MSNSLFYKVLALISTIGIIVLSGNEVFKSISESTETVEASLVNTKRELSQARKEALKEVKEVRKEILDEIKSARMEALDQIKKVGNDS